MYHPSFGHASRYAGEYEALQRLVAEAVRGAAHRCQLRLDWLAVTRLGESAAAQGTGSTSATLIKSRDVATFPAPFATRWAQLLRSSQPFLCLSQRSHVYPTEGWRARAARAAADSWHVTGFYPRHNWAGDANEAALGAL